MRTERRGDPWTLVRNLTLFIKRCLSLPQPSPLGRDPIATVRTLGFLDQSEGRMDAYRHSKQSSLNSSQVLIVSATVPPEPTHGTWQEMVR